MMNILCHEAHEISHRKFGLMLLSYQFCREININIRKHPSLFYRINAIKQHQSRRIRFKSILLEIERNEYTIDFAYQIIAIYPIEDIIGKSKSQLTLYSMGFVE